MSVAATLLSQTCTILNKNITKSTTKNFTKRITKNITKRITRISLDSARERPRPRDDHTPLFLLATATMDIHKNCALTGYPNDPYGCRWPPTYSNWLILEVFQLGSFFLVFGSLTSSVILRP
jgi:hypothetical protein